MEQKPIVAILLGDPAGVGSEIVAKLLRDNFFSSWCKPLVIGDKRVLDRAFDVIGTQVPMQVIDSVDDADWDGGTFPLLDQHDCDPDEVPFGTISVLGGKVCLDLLTVGAKLYQEGKIAGFCFAPLNKASMKDAGCAVESEHHYLASLFGHTGPFGEINVLDNLWTTRTTSHIPIKEVSDHLTVDSIMRAVRLAHYSLVNSGNASPHLGLCALNPHAGEEGRCGREEIDVIAPAIKAANAAGIHASGPYPSDIAFIKAFNGDFDAVVTMYHDQGQIALKLRGFDQGITIVGGLSAPIATCAHGTAYDIAGKGVVRTSAFENAVKMVSKMALARQGGQR